MKQDDYSAKTVVLCGGDEVAQEISKGRFRGERPITFQVIAYGRRYLISTVDVSDEVEAVAAVRSER